jgi:hypothetical protein
MLTTMEKGHPTASRIKGKPAIVKSLRSLLIRTARYGNRRAQRAADFKWSCCLLDALQIALQVAQSHDGRTQGTGARHHEANANRQSHALAYPQRRRPAGTAVRTAEGGRERWENEVVSD